MGRPMVPPLTAVLVVILFSIAAVLLTTAVIDGLASTSPSVTISIVSPTPAEPGTR